MNTKIEKRCQTCNTIFFVIFSRKLIAKFCSKKCKRLSNDSKLKISKSMSKYLKEHPEHGGLHYWKGKKMSEETKKKMRISAKKCINSGRWKKNLIPWNKNFKGCYTLKDVHLKNCNCSFCKAMRGELVKENHPNWIPDRDFLIYPDEFSNKLKITIRKRDNYKCQICNKKGLDVHHIDYNKSNNNENNLIILCRSCHIKTNFNREEWIKYFKNL